MRILVAVVAAVAVQMIVTAAPAAAAFPGRPGLIYFTSPNNPDSAPSCGVASVTAAGTGYDCVDPSGFDPAVSPDHRLIAETRSREGEGSAIYTVTLAGADARALTSIGVAQSLHPRFSQDGHRIVYFQYGGGSDGVYLMNADGSGQRQLTADHAIDPVFSPNDAQIADAGTGIAIANADASATHLLLANSQSATPLNETVTQLVTVTNSEPDWSPDGSQIAFVQETDTRTQTCNLETFECVTNGTREAHVYVMNADGSGLRQLTSNEGASELEPSWSPDGRQIAYFRQGNADPSGVGQVWVINADGSGNREVALGWHPYWSTVQRRAPARPALELTVQKVHPKRRCLSLFDDLVGATVKTHASKPTAFEISFYIDGKLVGQQSNTRSFALSAVSVSRGPHHLEVVASDFGARDTVSRTLSFRGC